MFSNLFSVPEVHCIPCVLLILGIIKVLLLSGPNRRILTASYICKEMNSNI